ncbi:MAG: C40 family peptidase [Bacteroidota bacterium]
MQVYRIIFRILIVFVSLIPLSGFGQTDSVIVVPPVKDSTLVVDTIPKKNSEQVDQIINFAKKYLGTPYRYGGTTPSGFDCSGFINYIFGNFGFSLTRTSYGLAEFGRNVKIADARAGDLIFFKGSSVSSTQVGHVGMVIEVGPGVLKFIHSANGGVQITNFIGSRYYVPRFVKLKRLDYGEESTTE